MKKRILIISLIVVCLALCAGATIAYFTAEDRATNVITAGNIQINLIENMIPKDGGEPVVFEDQDGIQPGETVSKIVQVKNEGKKGAYVRIAVDTVINLVSDTEAEAKGDPSSVIFDIDTENWTEKEGFYYYNKILASEETTEPLFTEVKFDENIGNEYMSSKTVITVVAQAVQADNNGDTVFDAAGWPELDTGSDDNQPEMN